MEPIIVLSYNIHHGEGTDGRLDLDRIAQVIRASGADLVALQEVDQKAARSGGIDQAAALARLTGMHHVFGAAMDFQGGAYGQAILSRWPIQNLDLLQLPQRAGREPRIVLRASIRAPIPLLFATTHLDHEIEEVRMEQAAALNASMRSRNAVTILAGDFNAVPESAAMRSLFTFWRDSAGEIAAPTIPAEQPSRRIDYILVHPGKRWTTIESRVLDEPVASDHRPVIATLRLQ